MATFRYDAYDSRPWAFDIAAGMRRKGEIAADAAARLGQIEADAQRQRGQIWGGTIQGIGQQVGSTLQQMNDPRRQADVINLQRMKDQQAGEQRLDQLVKPTMPNGPMQEGDTRQAQPSPYLDEKGLFKIPELSQALASSGMAHMAPDLLKGAEAINGSILQHQQTQQKLAQDETVMYGDIADGVSKMTKAGIPIAQALDFAAAPGLATKRFDPQTFAQFKGRLLNMAPEQQTAVLGGLMDAASKVSGNKTLGKDAQELDRYGRVVASNAVQEPGKGDYTINGQRFKPDGTPIGSVQPPQTLATSNEWKDVLLDGKPAKVFVDPKTKTVTTLGGQVVDNPDTRIKPVPTATQIRIDNPKLDTGAANVKETVKGMMDGSLPPILPGRATKEYIELTAEAHRQGFDLARAATDWAATQKHVATLNGTQQTRLMQSINQLPELLDSVDTLASKWKGGQFPILNKANLALAKGGAYGRDVASVANQLDAQIADVTSDLGAVYMGGNSPTDHSLDLAKKALSADWDEKVLRDMVKLARTNVQTRKNSINNTGVQGASTDNPYAAPVVSGPAVGTQRTINGTPAVWDGKGWKAK